MLRGKTAVVTGGSRGIGKAVALELASLGMNVAVIYAANEREAELVCRQCESRSLVRAESYRCDVSDFSQTEKTAAAICSDFSGISVLVNNAGITRDALLVSMKEQEFDAVLDTNLKGAFHMTRQLLPVFLKNREGCIINISSISGILGNRGQGNYAASKAGLIGLTKSVAREYASRNIRCSAVAPGYIRTDMTLSLEDQKLCAQIPLGRMGTPEDVAKAVAFLAQAEYITGEVLKVDGGAAM